jgi:transcriptional regulator with XRE-family HTH domain
MCTRLVAILQDSPKICIMATRRVEIGLTGETVRANINRLRREKKMTLRDLSDHMTQVVRPMAHNTISEIERGARRVDVDDLMALAAALGVSPIALLMPPTAYPDKTANTTVGAVTAHRLWQWLTAETPLTGDTPSEVFGFIVRSVPPWLLGTEIDLIESGVTPERTYAVRRREQLRELGTIREEIDRGDD